MSASTKASNFKFGTQLGFGEQVAKTMLVPNVVGAGWATGASKNCGDPLLISATVESNDFKYGTQLRF